MIDKIKLKLLRILFYSDLHATRCLLFLAEAIWAITLMIPNFLGSGDGCFSRPTYKIMSQICHYEEAWSVVWACSALAQLYVIIKGDYHGRFSVVFSGFNMLFWWVVVTSMYGSVSPPAAAISSETALAIGASWVYLRSGWTPKEYRRSHADIGC